MVERKFDTGATRDTDKNKIDYEACLSPIVIKRFGEYMFKQTFQKDGTIREPDNWQKGIPKQSYAKSLHRHFMDFWLKHRGHPVKTDMEEILCAIMFNAMGYLHEELK